MLIQSGWDLFFLLHPRVMRDRDAGRATVWMAVMNADLELIDIDRALDHVPTVLAEHAPAILDAVKRESKYERFMPRYIALGWAIDSYSESNPCGDREFDSLAELHGLQVLGQFEFLEDGFRTSGPAHEFKSYPLCDDLPRAVAIRGPHPMFECRCVACLMEEERIARLRTRSRTIAE